jgi:hypothetical protein
MGTNKDIGANRELALVVGLALAGVVAALVVVASPWPTPVPSQPVVGVVVPASDATEP